MMVLLTALLVTVAAPTVQSVWIQWIRGMLTRDNGQSLAVRRLAQMVADQRI